MNIEGNCTQRLLSEGDIRVMQSSFGLKPKDKPQFSVSGISTQYSHFILLSVFDSIFKGKTFHSVSQW